MEKDKFHPAKKKGQKDRPYTREEIQRLVEIADIRSKAIILFLSSSGMRIGALTHLKIKDLTPVEKVLNLSN